MICILPVEMYYVDVNLMQSLGNLTSVPVRMHGVSINLTHNFRGDLTSVPSLNAASILYKIYIYINVYYMGKTLCDTLILSHYVDCMGKILLSTLIYVI